MALLVLSMCACTKAPAFRAPAAGTPAPLVTKATPPPPTPPPSLTTLAPAPSAPLAVEHLETPPEPPRAQEPVKLDAPVQVELPYKLYERPRAEGAVLAAGQDEELARWNVGGTGDPNFVSSRPGYHPGARVVVDVDVIGGRLPKRSRGGMSQSRLLAQARSKGYWPIRICYEDALRRDAKQDGKTRIRLSLAPSSRVVGARVLESELDEPAAECLRDVLRKLGFSPGMPHGSVTAIATIKLWPGDAPVPVNDAPAGVTVDNPGVLDRNTARQTVVDARASLEDCYRAGLTRDPKLWGRVQLLVELDANGRLVRVSENESRFPDPEVTRCIVDTVTALSWPAVRGGKLTFNQGIRLGSLGGASDSTNDEANSSEEKGPEPPGATTTSD